MPTITLPPDAALRRSRQLLTASEQLSATETTADVLATVPALMHDMLAATHAEVVMAGVGRGPASGVAAALTAPVRREGVARFFAGPAELMAARPALAGDVARLGWQAAVCAPLPGMPGALMLAWSQPRAFSAPDRAFVVTLIRYVTRALQRAIRNDATIAASETLQRAIGSQLPQVEGYELAARYLPADASTTVGGDWYDVLPGPNGRLTCVIGDVVGHGLRAAAEMGQLRGMLRAYLVDRREPPSVLLRRLEAANHALGEPTMATAVVAIVEPAANGGHRLRWSNAGHPPPVVIHPDRTVHALTGNDMLLGMRRNPPRHTYTYHLPPGSTVLLHTDGLVEDRERHIDESFATLYRRLRAGGRPHEVLAAAASLLTGVRSDDVAMLAVRVPGLAER
ncbi:PP2C family protein-serine/threonine phosphatase [Actinoplanes sp. NPDC023936]|uniref:PP2C family protein-serine/threonine phosphatase n=1 Tax=Actinoplanes sp. NPDC023936 TaxID=3154910 RepID=UPI0033C84D3C